MIETKLLAYLKDKLNTNHIYLETPKTLPKSFVVFQIVDRSRENLIDAVTVRLWSYASTKAETAVLDDSVRKAMYDFTDIDDISSSTIGGNTDSFDTSLKLYRYTSYFNITYMEE